MALSQQQLDKAKKAIEYLSSLSTGPGKRNRSGDPLPRAGRNAAGTAPDLETSLPTSATIKSEKGEPKLEENGSVYFYQHKINDFFNIGQCNFISKCKAPYNTFDTQDFILCL